MTSNYKYFQKKVKPYRDKVEDDNERKNVSSI